MCVDDDLSIRTLIVSRRRNWSDVDRERIEEGDPKRFISVGSSRCPFLLSHLLASCILHLSRIIPLRSFVFASCLALISVITQSLL